MSEALQKQNIVLLNLAPKLKPIHYVCRKIIHYTTFQYTGA